MSAVASNTRNSTAENKPRVNRTKLAGSSRQPDAGAVIANRMKAAVAFIRDRVLAHLGSPTSYPLPADAKSLEQALLRNVGAGRGRRREREIDDATARIKSSGATRTKHYGELAGLDATSATSTGDQVLALALPSPLSEADRSALAAPTAARRLAVPGRLDLAIHTLECVKKTVHFPEIDGRDEIVVSAGISGVGVASASREVYVGKFRKKDVESVKPNPFLSVHVADINDPAAAAIASFDLTEKDRGNSKPAPVSEGLVGALILGVAGAAIFSSPSTLTLVIEGTVLFSQALPALPGLAIAAGIVALASGVVLLVHLFKRLGVDEEYNAAIAEPVLLTAIPSLIGKKIATNFVATREQDGFNGQYRLTYSWNLARDVR